MATIKKIIASEIINSRGYPTIFGRLVLDDNHEVSASVPSFEAIGDYQHLVFLELSIISTTFWDRNSKVYLPTSK